MNIKTHYIHTSVALCLFFLALLFCSTSFAVTLPYTFSAGSPSRAVEVNENFAALADVVNEILEAKSECIGTGPGDEMVRVGSVCVDKYEASVWSETVAGEQIVQEQSCNTNPVNCYCHPDGSNCSRLLPGGEKNSNAIFARSVKGVKAAAHFTWFQAQQACANVGKRLLSNAEWQMAVAGTNKSNCDVDDGNSPALDDTGENVQCISNWGVNDMVGGLWERVADWVQGKGVQKTLPDGSNVNIWSPIMLKGTIPEALAPVGGLYKITDVMAGINPARVKSRGVDLGKFPGAIIRGGSYNWGLLNSGEFALLADWSPMAMTNSIGFRCGR